MNSGHGCEGCWEKFDFKLICNVPQKSKRVITLRGRRRRSYGLLLICCRNNFSTVYLPLTLFQTASVVPKKRIKRQEIKETKTGRVLRVAQARDKRQTPRTGLTPAYRRVTWCCVKTV